MHLKPNSLFATLGAFGWRQWMSLMRWGDWLTIGLSVILCAACFWRWWSVADVDRAVVRQGGRTVVEVKLGEGLARREFRIPGALGISVIEVEDRRARVQSDPSPRQLCVQQGWLTRANALALCAPNQVSVQLLPRRQAFDSLHY